MATEEKPLYQLHLISVPCTQRNIDLLQAQVDDLGGIIIEEVTVDQAAKDGATIFFND